MGEQLASKKMKEMDTRKENTNELLQSLVSLSEKDAIEKAAEKGFKTRTVYRDGEDYIITMDMRFDRINLSIEDDRVIKAHIG